MGTSKITTVPNVKIGHKIINGLKTFARPLSIKAPCSFLIIYSDKNVKNDDKIVLFTGKERRRWHVTRKVDVLNRGMPKTHGLSEVVA